MEITLNVKPSYSSAPTRGSEQKIPAGPALGAELVAATADALEQLGELTDHIEKIELSFEKPALAHVLWPVADVTVQASGIPTSFQIHIKTGSGCDVRPSSPFPSARFAKVFIEEIRRQLHLKITAHRESLDGLSSKLAPPAQSDVA